MQAPTQVSRSPFIFTPAFPNPFDSAAPSRSLPATVCLCFHWLRLLVFFLFCWSAAPGAVCACVYISRGGYSLFVVTPPPLLSLSPLLLLSFALPLPLTDTHARVRRCAPSVRGRALSASPYILERVSTFSSSFSFLFPIPTRGTSPSISSSLPRRSLLSLACCHSPRSPLLGASLPSTDCALSLPPTCASLRAIYQ